MIPTIQFDQASLAVWTTTSNLPDEIAASVAAVIDAAMKGENPSDYIADFADNDPWQQRAQWIASNVWHEKRHFFDTCLTNYGARRFRDLFNLAANFWPLVAEASSRREPVWFPVEVYGCKTRRRILGIAEPGENIAKIAQRARAMKSIAGDLDAAAVQNGQAISIGASAQLEGLAQTSQMNAIEHHFGLDALVGITFDHVHNLAAGSPYRAIETVSMALGCKKTTRKGAIAVNIGLASAIFVTALCGRFFAGRQVEEDLVSPRLRLIRLVQELGPSPGDFEMSDEAAWEMVDAAAVRLWGRTAFDELAADIGAMEKATDRLTMPWMLKEGLNEAWRDFTSLRRRMLAAARELGPASLSPRAFAPLWLDRILPWHVISTPNGRPGQENGATPVLAMDRDIPAGLEHLFPKQSVWASLREPAPVRLTSGFGLGNRDAWLLMVERHGPRARLMLNGRAYRLMAPPELERQLADIAELDIQVRFDPPFEWPADRSNATREAEARALADWSHRTHFVCDLTGEEIAPDAAAVLTPWEFRRSPLLSQYRAAWGSDVAADIQLKSDWSDWVVRRDLLPG